MKLVMCISLLASILMVEGNWGPKVEGNREGTTYFLKELGELCNDNELITNLAECKSAVSELKNTGTDIKFHSTIVEKAYERYPKGCIENQGRWNYGYWNPAVTGSGSDRYSRPICKITSNGKDEGSGGTETKTTAPNPCDTSNGGCEDSCTNNNGVAECFCTTGSLKADGKSCETGQDEDDSDDDEVSGGSDEEETIRQHFNETCCLAHDVPEECMGLCREKNFTLQARSIEVLPTHRCVEHHKTIIDKCLVAEVHCEWNKWQTGACSQSCGSGTRTNTRTKKIDEANGGSCKGEREQQEPCNTQHCPLPCEWAAWGNFAECSQTCGGGHHTRSRVIASPALYGGAACEGEALQSANCNEDPCPIDCEWTAFGDWSECSKPCNSGLQSRERTVKIDAENGGENCTGLALVERVCNVHNCAVHCEYEKWSPYKNCSVECGGGEQFRTRGIAQAAAYGGTECNEDMKQTQSCNEQPCPVHCKWDEWNEWDTCSLTCGGGMTERVRHILTYAQHGGENCEGEAAEMKACNNQNCPIPGSWGEWSDWDKCAVSCGGADQGRTRVCDNPAPQFGGDHCTVDNSSDSDTQRCNENPCAITFHFNATCCQINKVPDDCMGLCREKDRIDIIYPIDRCVDYQKTIRKCMYSDREVPCETQNECPDFLAHVCENGVCVKTPYSLKSGSELCTGKGEIIEHFDECEAAVKAISSISYKTTIRDNTEFYPKGCYTLNGGVGYPGYFNMHITGRTPKDQLFYYNNPDMLPPHAKVPATAICK